MPLTSTRGLPTFDDCSAVPTDWSLDGQQVFAHASKEGQIFREPKVYRVPLGLGQPWRAMDCHAASARLSPDGQYIAFVRGGSKWCRRGYAGSANYDIWLCETETGQFTQFTDFDGTDRLPCWDGDGAGLYFLSERGGTVNVWYKPLAGGPARQITDMSEDDVRDLAVSADGRTLALTHWDKLYVMSLPADEPPAGWKPALHEVTITAGSDSPLAGIEHRTYRNNAGEAEVSPDGKEIALVVRGEIFVIKTEEKKPTRRTVTRT